MTYECGYVYVIEVASLGCVKIGSTVDVKHRLGVIQTSVPGEITRRWLSRKIPDYKECERELHNLFSDKRRHGEWFDVGYVEAVIKADEITRDGYLVAENKRLREENFSLRKRIEEMSEANVATDR